MIENGNMFQNLLIIQRNTNLNYFCKMYRNEANKDVTLILINTIKQVLCGEKLWQNVFLQSFLRWRGSVSVYWCTDYTEEKVAWTRLH